jgi:EmrB/QacA subfamily drug resistance transporter
MDPKISVSVVFVAAFFMNIMDSTIVNVALPTLRTDFRVSTASVSAVVTGYLVSLAVVMPASGWIGDRFGGKRILLLALAGFTVASAACGLARNLPELIAFRALQGIAGGLLTPTGMAMLYRTFPQAERIRATRILMIPTLMAPALGPVVGGILVDGLSWRWIFYVNLPIGVAAVVFGALFLREHREPAAGRFDLPGFLLAGCGFPLAMYALSEGASLGWSSTRVLVSGLLGLALLVAFVTVELRRAEPMLHLRMFGNRLFRTANLQSGAGTAGFLGMLFLVPLFLQNGLGMNALHSGLNTFPEAIGGMVGTQVSSRLYRRVGPRRLMTGGLVAAAIFIGLMSSVGAGDVHWAMPALMFLTGIAIGFSMAPSVTASLATISKAATGQAMTLTNTQRQVASALGVAIIGTVLAAVGTVSVTGGVARPQLGAYHVGFAVAAGLMLLGAAFASRIRDTDAAPTMAVPVSPEAAATAAA